jgi:hypothetical protein
MIRLASVLIAALATVHAASTPQPPQITVAKPSGKTRVTAGVALQPARAAAGESVTVFVKARIAEDHWIYAMEKSGSKNLPTRVDESVPSALESRGPWRSPAPNTQEDGSRILAGDDVLFQRQYRIATDARPQKYKLRFKLEVQVCNDMVCWPPETIDMETELEVVKSR